VPASSPAARDLTVPAVAPGPPGQCMCRIARQERGQCMTMLDLSEAARLVGRDVSTLHRAMVSGRLSFTKPHRQAPARPGRARTGVRDQGYHYQSDLSRQRRRSRSQCARGRNDSPSARTARDRSRRKAAHVGAADRAAGAVVASVVQMSGCAGKRYRDGACRAGERLTAGK